MRVQAHVDVISVSEINGWAIDWDQPASILDISVILNGVEVGQCKTDIKREGLSEALGGTSSGVHEFRYTFDPTLDTRDHHHIEVVTTKDYLLLPNGRRRLHPIQHGGSRLTPILLTSGGRSGTTMLMREFVTHPDIAVANAYPFEFKLASYYAAAWNVLTQSTHLPTADEIDFASRSAKDMVIGRNPWNRPDLLRSLGGNHATRLIRNEFPDRLAHLFSATVQENYEIVATETNKTPHFFAEKSTLEQSVRQTCRLLFGDVKEIVLVRDPRDYICSAKMFWHQTVDAALTTLSIELPILMNIFDENRGDVIFVRYEDLVLDPVGARRRLYDFIRCDATFKPHPSVADDLPPAHTTSRSPAESIGRFRHELDIPTLRRCHDTFKTFMHRFDYTL